MVPVKKRVHSTGPEDCIDSSADETIKSVKSIESISDKELLSISSRLPLCDLQSLELVSHRFRWIALKVYSDRRSLSLLQTPQYRTQLETITRYWYFTDYTTRHPFGQDCYHVTRVVNSSGIRLLRERFPNVTQLTLYCVDHLSVERFVQLIQLYPTLERLVLFSNRGQQTEYSQTQFWTALYGLRASLCHLSLPFASDYYFHLHQLSPLFTPTLQSLYLNSQLQMNEAFGEIAHNLKHFYIMGQDLLRCRYLCLIQLLPIHAAAADGLGQVAHNRVLVKTRFGLYISENNSALSSRNKTRFNLQLTSHLYLVNEWKEMMTHLDLVIPCNVDLLSVLPDLARFNRLTHIRLTEHKTGQPPVSVFFSGLNRQNYQTKLGQLNQTQMPSVRQLNLFQFDINLSSGIFLYLSVIFPQVSVLHLEDCPMSDSVGKHTFPGWFLNSLQCFAQLRQLYHNHRLVLEMNREEDVKRDELIRVIEEQMLNKDMI